jgi:Mn-dependent DtxR family transcriptional regulator
MALYESAEMYLETIYVLSKKTGFVRSIDVAEYMGYSKPSVSRAVGLLKKGGYLTMEKDGYLTLTDKGRETADSIFERHTVLTKFLEYIGVDNDTASKDACKIEHVVSDTTLGCIKSFLEKSK